MSSFLYRPTPVVHLGRGPFASRRVRMLPGSTMLGIPAGASVLGKGSPTGAGVNMRRANTAAQPWIQTAGTMHGFTPHGLGGLRGLGDDSTGIDWSTFDGSGAPIIPPSLNTPDLVPPDFASPSFSPTMPVSISPLAPPSDFYAGAGASPSLPTDSAGLPTGFFSGASASPLAPQPSSPVLTQAQLNALAPVAPVTPPAGAGATGTGIPGTQAANPAPVANSVSSFLSSIFGKSSAPAKPAYTQLPGYSSAMVASPAPSTALASMNTWFAQNGQTILLLGGAVVLIGALGTMYKRR